MTNRAAVMTVGLFATGGPGFGEAAGPMVGAGVEFRQPNNRVGFRFALEDYIARVGGFDCAALGYTQAYCELSLSGGRPYTAHQVGLRFGLLF